MAGALVRYAYTEGEDVRQDLILSALDPVHQARAILEQVVYRSYILHSVRNITACLQDYCDHVLEMVRALPEIRNDLSGPESAIYHACTTAIRQFPFSSFATYDSILSAPSTSAYWKPSITRNFYLPFLSLIGAGYNSEEKELPNAHFLIPMLESYQRPVISIGMPPEASLRMKFNIIPLTSFSYTLGPVKYDCAEQFLSRYLSQASYTDWTVDHFIGLLSNFCVEPGHHALTNHQQYTRGVADICYEMLHPSRHHARWKHQHVLVPTKQKGGVQGVRYILDMLKLLLTNNRIGESENTLVFSEFLANSGQYSQELINYFAKPVNDITALEAHAYRASEFSQYFSDRIVLGVESSSSETGGSDDATIGEDAASDTDVPEDGMGEDQDLGDPDASMKMEDTDTPPKRDPVKLLLELAKPDEKLSDYLYRRVVMERMATIVASPPIGIPTGEILLMKRYLSMWINLVSVASIKDFLSRLSFQLMGTRPPKGNDALK